MMIILASHSKRRSEILRSCGIRHKVIRSGIREIAKGRFPERIAMVNALSKAAKVAHNLDSGYVIGADTVVKLGRYIIGKPRNKSHAKAMLRAMSGKAVSVYTGLCIIDVKKRRLIVDYERSDVNVKKIKRSELSVYFTLLGPYNKAGGFSIEGPGSLIFDDIRGSYFNIQGLPMAKLKDMFEKLGRDILRKAKVKR